MKSCYLACLLASLSFVTAQTDSLSAIATNTVVTDESTFVPTETATPTDTAYLSATAVPTDEACAVVSSQLTQATAVAAAVLNACQLSVPLIKQDALDLIDGIVAGLQFQSDIGDLKNPPEGYLLEGVDLLSEIQQIRDNVDSGVLTSEIEFERNMTLVLAKAQDGHLHYFFDGMYPFLYQRSASLVSVSADGKELPKLYLYVALSNYLTGTGGVPLEVTQINGENAAEFLQRKTQNITYGSFEDPDALYNSQLYALNGGRGSATGGGFLYDFSYQGENTTYTFADGSSRSFVNFATLMPDYGLNGLTDGVSYYDIFCNATRKKETLYGGSSKTLQKVVSKHSRNQDRVQPYHAHLRRQESAASSTAASATPTATQLVGYPSPIAISPDLTISGYFLDQSGFEDTAVLVIQKQSFAAENYQSTLRDFLAACRNANKTRLVLDVQGNGGGNVATGYDTFRQLFPDLYPYAAGTLRAHEGLDLLGQFWTNYSATLLQQADGNETAATDNGYSLTQWNAGAYLNDSGQTFESWPELYGPVETERENYTNLVRWDIQNVNFDIGAGGLLISGAGNLSEIAPSPFTSDNIILLTDGQCSSTCTTLAHLLKWQGKVKSVTVGGRPQTGAMQAIGGVKGREVFQFSLIYYAVATAYSVASQYVPDFADSINKSISLGPINNLGEYTILRTGHAGIGDQASQDFEVNWVNNVAEGDTSYTPLQFVYEAADCRLWFQPKHIGDVSTLWYDVAAQAFGLNGTEVFSLCVEGSTNQPSSLSGNATLYNNGVGNNVTDFQPEQVNGSETGNSNGSNGGGNGSGNHNAAGRSTASSVVIICAIALAIFML